MKSREGQKAYLLQIVMVKQALGELTFSSEKLDSPHNPDQGGGVG